MKHIQSITMMLLLWVGQSQSSELFPNGVLRNIAYREVIEQDVTIGGYPILLAGEKWQFEKGKAGSSTGGKSQIKMGSVTLVHFEGTKLFAMQSIAATTESGSNTYWSGEPCSPNHLVIRQAKKAIREDHCLTIDPMSTSVGNKPVTLLNVVITQSGSQGRYYQVAFGLNLEMLGFLDSSAAAWTEISIKEDKRKAKLLEKVTLWAENYFSFSNELINYTKPSPNLFEKVPPYRDLVPSPLGLKEEKYSVEFLSALEDISNRVGNSSIAFSRYKDHITPHGYAYGMGTKEMADKLAIDNCEKMRPVEAEKCTLFDLTQAQIKNQAFQPTNTTDREIDGGKSLPSNKNNSMSLDTAKTKCEEIGFKVGTENFGKCVLQLIK
jgi:hypothetical protein